MSLPTQALRGILLQIFFFHLLPPAYVVRREGNSYTLFVSPHLGGVPISHNALQHFPECHGAATGGVPCQVQPGGVPWWGGTLPGVPCQEGGTLPGVPRSGTPPARSGQGVPCQGGTPARGGVSCRGVPRSGTPPSQVRMGGGTQLEQHREYLLHGGQYASCVQPGGLSCFIKFHFRTPI